ncbi:MAG: phycobilisome rod-core linker polypeptide CpcG [Synechococcaceae cyanobacterium SM2_3_1]|nr:phycobilisome rod-core linker polypeptide CpcG [Synechococcaceae cyanobacterium SM2_3_1]
MPLPLLEYAPSSQNQRVKGFDIPTDDLPPRYSNQMAATLLEVDSIIEAAYRQIFFCAFACDRDATLESQLRYGQISVRDFIRSLLLSRTFRDSFYDKNSNYRVVEQCVQRVLGRDVYSEREKIAWSIVIATKGFQGFIDDLLNSQEYLDNFGYDQVPYQRRRVLPGSGASEIPFNIKSPRYDEYYRKQLGFPQFVWKAEIKRFRPQELQPKAGDPTQYLNLARAINPRGVTPQKISAYNIDFEKMVPRRR